MSDNITLTGVVATEPELKTTASGATVLSFRLASAQRKFDKQQGTWVDTNTNWYTVTAWSRLAENARESIGKGDRIFVSGRLTIEDWERNGKNGTAIEITAETLGHDLFWGVTSFRKPQPAAQPNDPWASNPSAAPF